VPKPKVGRQRIARALAEPPVASPQRR